MTDDADSWHSECTFTPDELDIDIPRFVIDHEIGFESLEEECSRPVWDGTMSARCVWHADGIDKPLEKLEATVGDGDLAGVRARGMDLTVVRFPPDSIFRGADFRRADLIGADLGGADLSSADLRRATSPIPTPARNNAQSRLSAVFHRNKRR